MTAEVAEAVTGEMTERIEKALEYHHKGYNCAQAVVCAYCDLLGMDEQTAYRMAEGFGFGFGGKQEVCGAVSGMTMLAGIKCSNGELEGPRTKKDTYKVVKGLCEAFEKKNTSIRCGDLMGRDGKGKLRSCDGCIEDASRIVEELLLDK